MCLSMQAHGFVHCASDFGWAGLPAKVQLLLRALSVGCAQAAAVRQMDIGKWMAELDVDFSQVCPISLEL